MMPASGNLRNRIRLVLFGLCHLHHADSANYINIIFRCFTDNCYTIYLRVVLGHYPFVNSAFFVSLRCKNTFSISTPLRGQDHLVIILQAPFLITEKKRPEKQHRRAKNTKKKPSLQIALLWAMSWHVFADQVPAVDSPVSPTESLEHIIVAPDLDVQLAAHEPQVIDPVAIRMFKV